MKIRSLILTLAIAAMSAGMLSAQGGPRRGFGPDKGEARGAGGPMMNERWLTRNLGLSAEQSNKIHSILSDARVGQQGSREKMQSIHTSLANAVKSGDEGQIESLTRQMGDLHQQQLASHAKTMAKVYATLTPDQKQKIAPQIDGMFGGGPRPRRQPPAAKQ